MQIRERKYQADSFGDPKVYKSLDTLISIIIELGDIKTSLKVTRILSRFNKGMVDIETIYCADRYRKVYGEIAFPSRPLNDVSGVVNSLTDSLREYVEEQSKDLPDYINDYLWGYINTRLRSIRKFANVWMITKAKKVKEKNVKTITNK